MPLNTPHAPKGNGIQGGAQRPVVDDRAYDAAPAAAGASDFRSLAQRLSKDYAVRDSDTTSSLLQFLVTFAGFAALLAMMTMAAHDRYWLTLLLAIPTAGLLVRLFIVQHDCGHGAFFRSRQANEILGRFISVFTLTPYDHWKRSHAMHHATSGNLDRRGDGDVPTMTVKEYQALSPLGRLGYRLFRSPLIMIIIGAPVNFIILQRLPLGRALRDRESLRSILGLNLALVIAFGPAMALLGVATVLAVYLPMMILAAWVGGWLFYVQHQFEDTYWTRDGDWDFYRAAMAGSSYFELPRVLQWFTGNIGLHHIHHMCSRIPNYRLQDCINAFPELRDAAKRIGIRDSMKCWRYALWDEEKNLLVGFADLRA